MQTPTATIELHGIANVATDEEACTGCNRPLAAPLCIDCFEAYWTLPSAPIVSLATRPAPAGRKEQ